LKACFPLYTFCFSKVLCAPYLRQVMRSVRCVKDTQILWIIQRALNCIMEYTFKQAKLSEVEKLWLTEILKLNFAKVDLKYIKVKLWKNLPKHFKPEEIDNRLVRDNRLTLIGLWHVDPNNALFKHVSKCSEIIRDLIFKNPWISQNFLFVSVLATYLRKTWTRVPSIRLYIRMSKTTRSSEFWLLTQLVKSIAPPGTAFPKLQSTFNCHAQSTPKPNNS